MFSALEPVRSGETFIKVCGISNVDDARLCAALGVDAIGMLLEKPGAARKPHSDRLSVAEAGSLVAALPDGLLPVLLIHTTEVDLILDLCDQIGPAALQVQTSIPPQDLLEVKTRWSHLGIIKSFTVAPEAAVEPLLSGIQAYWDCGSIDAVLLDSARGGSGRVHDWPLSAKLVQRLPHLPIVLAGGLTATNVDDALRQVRPRGVDVMSSVTSPERDKKDPAKLRAFVQAVRAGGVSRD